MVSLAHAAAAALQLGGVVQLTVPESERFPDQYHRRVLLGALCILRASGVRCSCGAMMHGVRRDGPDIFRPVCVSAPYSAAPFVILWRSEFMLKREEESPSAVWASIRAANAAFALQGSWLGASNACAPLANAVRRARIRCACGALAVGVDVHLTRDGITPVCQRYSDAPSPLPRIRMRGRRPKRPRSRE